MPNPQRQRSARDILTDLGAVPFEWTLADDHLRWGSNALQVLGLDRFERISSGKAWTALIDPATPLGRSEAIRRSVDTDSGEGIAYEIEYAIRPAGAEGPPVFLSESGRWYSDGRGRPARVAGLVRRIARLGTAEGAGQGTDRLTGEMDRAGIIGALDMAIAATQTGKNSIALLFGSIDGLDGINDAFGKKVGDDLLLGAMKRLKRRLRGGDVIGRIGGNRFALILSDCNEKAVVTAGNRFADGVRSKPFTTDVGPLWLTLSLGGVVVPAQARTTEDALDRADDALRRARAIGPGTFHAYRRDQHASTLRLENRETILTLQQALKEERVGLATRPLCDLETGEEIDLHAVAVAEIGEFPPAAFGDLAARLNLGTPADLRLLDLAFAWLDQHGDRGLSLDVGPSAIAARVWGTRALKLIKQSPDHARRLTIGISARALSQSNDLARHLALDLKGLGCHLAITDLGAPGTDLLTVIELQPSRLVPARDLIERTIREPTFMVSARALTEVAKSIGARAVAMGVADQAWLPALTLAGFDTVEAVYAGESRLAAA